MSELAFKLIAENKKTRDTFLDLGDCGLTEIPKELGELVWLEELSFSHSFINSEGEWVSKNKRGKNRLSSLYTKVKINPFSKLIKLELLSLNGNRELNDLSPLSTLTEIKFLDIRGTQVNDLSPILKSISPKFELKYRAIAWEDCDFWNNVHAFPRDCPLTTPPIEIVKQGNEAILNYFSEKKSQGSDKLYETKILLIGEAGAGKTSLLRRLYQPEKPLPKENESTKGIDIIRHDFKLKNGRNFRLNVWDFGGQEIYHATHQFS